MNLSFANVQGNLQLEVQILRDATFLCLSLSQESSLASCHLLCEATKKPAKDIY